MNPGYSDANSHVKYTFYEALILERMRTCLANTRTVVTLYKTRDLMVRNNLKYLLGYNTMFLKTINIILQNKRV